MATPHDAAFLQAIRENPDDDAPRLIYADWLEERGQADRAEFIRIQCRLFGIPHTDPAASDLKVRAEELLRTNWQTWVGPLRNVIGSNYSRYGESWMREEYHPDGLRRFRRGFVDTLALDAERFLHHAKALLALTPLRELRLWGAGHCARALMECPHLAGLETLQFCDYWVAPLTARDVPALAASPYLHGLIALYLGWNSLGDQGVEALVWAYWLKSLVTLDLSDNGITDAGAYALANCPYLDRLQTLFLRRNDISNHGRTALATSPHLRQVRKLELIP